MLLGKPEVLLELNARVHEAARRFEGAEPERDLWDFTCECGAAGCRAAVSLTLAEYEALRAGEHPILAAGHEEDRVAVAHATAQELAEDAAALQAQAELQQKRAERNTRRA
jgi:hypothetical protein